MFSSIKGRLMAAGVVIALLLGALAYVTSIQMASIEQTLADLEKLQDVKSHVLQPQKDMNQFIAAMDSTVLFLELGDPAAAQTAYEASVDAEQDISSEFEYLEANAPEALLPQIEETHIGWEMGTEFMKMRAEALAKEEGIALTRPALEIKVLDSHVDSGIAVSLEEYGRLTFAEMNALYQDRETSPMEIADEGIDTTEEMTDEYLAEERAAGAKAVAQSGQTVMFGALIALVAIVVLGAVVTNSVSRPLSELKSGAEKIAEGDLDYEFKNIPKDEVGAVINSVEKMAGGLKTRIRNMEEMAGIVMVTGEEIGSAAQAAKSAGANVDEILAKTDTLKGLVGQMIADTKA